MFKKNVLLVMALSDENEGNRLGEFAEVLYTGVGKINATLKLTEALLQRDREDLLVVNVGSAGSHRFSAGTVVCAHRFFERDMDASALGCLPGQTPFEEHVYLDVGLSMENLPLATCFTGDSFVSQLTTEPLYELIDMEAYALAKTCHYFNVPFVCIKYVTDGADGQAATDWRQSLVLATDQLVGTLRQSRIWLDHHKSG